MRLKKRLPFSFFLFAAPLAILASCSGGESGGPTPQLTRQDSTSAVIGAAGGVIVTPNGDAGIQIPAGALTQQSTITVTKLSPGTPTQGPLPTSLNQYAPYYEVSISPANAQLGDSVRVGICQVTDPSSQYYAPEALHGQLRLAHAVGATTEILEPVAVGDFLNCAAVTASNDRWRGSSRLGRAFASAANSAVGFLSPRTLHAAHGGLGGKVKSFSPFGAVDPLTGLVIGPETAFAATALEEDLGGVASDGTNYLVTFSNRTPSNQLTSAAQLVSATGSPIGAQIALPGTSAETAVVAFDGTNYLVAWRINTGTPTIFGQFIDKSGALVGGNFLIATTAEPTPSTMIFGGGTYLIVYTRRVDPQLGDFGYRSMAKTISPSGVVGPQLTLNTSLANDGFNNAAFDGTNFLVAYTNGTTIRGRFISTAGVLGLENTITSRQNMVSVLALGYSGANYVVAFSAGEPFLDAFAQIYSPAGAIVGGQMTLANNSGDHEMAVSVTPAGANFVVSFLDGFTAPGNARIKAKLITAAGSTKLPAFVVAGPRDGKVPGGFIANYNGSKFLAIFVRGIQTAQADLRDVNDWIQKDSFTSLLTIPIPP